MPTIRLVPSTYAVSSTSYLSVADASNAYTNTDSTTYATITNTYASTSSRYYYLRGFNFDDIPSNAIINSFTVKLKARESGVSTSSSYQPYLANGTTAINGSCSPITTTATTQTFSGISANWETISGYGSNFGIRINCRRASRNTTGYVYIYGAEILVDYTIPVYHSVSFNNTSSVSISPSITQSVIEGNDLTIQINTSNKNAVRVSDNNVDVSSQVVQGTGSCTYTISNVQADHTISVTDAPSYNVSITNNSETVTTQPSSTQTLFEGDSQEISFYNISSLDDVTITDNSNDIESQLVHSTGGTRSVTLIPSSLSGNSGTVTDSQNGLSDTSSTTYAEVSGSSTYYMEYSFDTSSIPSNATINSISCSVKAAHTRTYQAAGSAQLYAGSTAMGSSYTFGSTATVFDLTTGTWTLAELQTLKLRIGSTYIGTSTYYTRFYGAELTVNYTVQEDVYTYTISNISADHAIAIADVAPTPYFLKVNNEFRPVKKIFRKVNNAWVEISVEDLASIQGPYFYKGWQEEIIYDVLGEVTRSSSDITIVINDNTLSPGDYTLYYEDENGNIISGVDEIANITIS